MLKITGWKKKKKKRMRTLFQDESLEFYCKGLPGIEKKFLANIKDEIIDFPLPPFISTAADAPAHSNVWSRLSKYKGLVPLPLSYPFLRDLFPLTRTRLRLL